MLYIIYSNIYNIYNKYNVIFTSWRKNTGQNLTPIHDKKIFYKNRNRGNFISPLQSISVVESIFIVETVSTLPLRIETSPGMSAYITTGSPSQHRKAGKQRHNNREGGSQAVLADNLILCVENSKESTKNLTRSKK